MDIYDFSFIKNDGSLFSFSCLRGKIVLVFNSAVHDALSSQYRQLEQLYQKYRNLDFEILDFPCNQFHGMAPEDDAEIQNLIENEYHTSFYRFRKCDVKGKDVNPLFAYLVSKKKFRGLDSTNPISKIVNANFLKEGHSLLDKSPEIRWNFTKFLIDRHGKVSSRFECTDSMEKIEKAISRLLDTQPIFQESNTDGVFFEK